VQFPDYIFNLFNSGSGKLHATIFNSYMQPYLTATCFLAYMSIVLGISHRPISESRSGGLPDPSQLCTHRLSDG